MFNVAVIVGSLRKASINKKLALAAAEEGKDLFTFNIVNLDDVPLFNQDLEGKPGEGVVGLRKAITASDVVLFVTPEYNRSLPAVMKNAIDWASRPYGKNSVKGKPAAIMGASMGAIGTAVAQSHLRSIITMLGMPLVDQPELYINLREGIIGEDGKFTDESTKKYFRSFLEGMDNWLKNRK